MRIEHVFAALVTLVWSITCKVKSVEKFDRMHKDLKWLRVVSPDSPRKEGWRRREGIWRIYSQPWLLFSRSSSAASRSRLAALSGLNLPAEWRQIQRLPRASKQTSLLYLFPLTEGASLLAFLPASSFSFLHLLLILWMDWCITCYRHSWYPDDVWLSLYHQPTAKYIVVRVHDK